MSALESAELWTTKLNEVLEDPIQKHSCPMCEKGRLCIRIVPVGAGVEVFLQCDLVQEHSSSAIIGVYR